MIKRILAYLFSFFLAAAIGFYFYSYLTIKTVRVGYLPQYLAIESTLNNSTNFVKSYFDEISKYAGWNVELVAFSNWDESLKALEEGKIDFLGPKTKYDFVPHVFRNLLFSKNNFGFSNINLYADRTYELGYNNFENIDDKTVIYHSYTNHDVLLKNFARKNDLNLEYDDVTLIDLFYATPLPSEELLAIADIYAPTKFEAVANIGVAPIHFFTTANNALLLNELDQALSDIYKEDLNFSYKFISKDFYFNTIAKPTFTEAEKKAIEEYKTFRVAFGLDYAPMQSLNAMNEPEGLSINFINYLAEELGLEIEYIPFYNNETKTFLDVDASITFTDGEDFRVYSPRFLTYFDTPLVAVGELTMSLALPTNRIGSLDYSTSALEMKNQLDDKYHLSFFSNSDILYKNLQEDVLTHVIEPAFIDTIEEYTREDTHFVYPLNTSLSYKITFSDHISDEFISAFDKTLQTLPKQVLNLFMLEYINRPKKVERFSYETISDVDPYLFVIVAISMSSIVLLAFCLNFNATNKKLLNAVNYDSYTGLYTPYAFYKEARNILDVAEKGEYMIVSYNISTSNQILSMYGSDGMDAIFSFIAKQLGTHDNNQNILATRLDFTRFIILTKSFPFEKSKKVFDRVKPIYLDELTGKNILPEAKLERQLGVYYVTEPHMPVYDILSCANYASEITNTDASAMNLYTTRMNKERQKASVYLVELDRSMKNYEFKLHLLPKIHPKTDKIIGAEILVRWIFQNKELEAEEFKTIFEKNHVIDKLDLHVFQESCKLITKLPDLRNVNINISLQTLVKPNMPFELSKIAHSYNVSPTSIKIDIREPENLVYKNKLQEVTHDLKKYGFGISIENFASDQSTLFSIFTYKIDAVKIDKSFFDSIKTIRERSILNTLLSTFKLSNIEVVITSIETAYDFESVKDIDCNAFQGYYFSKPLTEREFVDYYYEKLRTEHEEALPLI